MKGPRGLVLCVTVLLATAWTVSVDADPPRRYVLVVSGVSGSPEHAERHARWRTTLIETLRGPLGLPDGHLRVLHDDGAGDEDRATAANVRRVVEAWRPTLGDTDLLVVVLIGHGTYDGVDAKFNLVGPDLEAAEWAALLDGLRGSQVVVNTASASFPFLRRLAGPRRVVVTATDSPLQKYDTVFAEFFVQAFTADEADLDKDGRVSIGEAFTFAGMRARRWYEQRGQLATERALIDDDGDGIGQEAGALGSDGALASRLFLDEGPEIARSRDPALSELLGRRESLEASIDELRRKRTFMPPDDYDRELERLLIELARLSRRIRGVS